MVKLAVLISTDFSIVTDSPLSSLHMPTQDIARRSQVTRGSNGWRRVSVSFTTRDAGGKLTAKDFAAAEAIDGLDYPRA